MKAVTQKSGFLIEFYPWAVGEASYFSSNITVRAVSQRAEDDGHRAKGCIFQAWRKTESMWIGPVSFSKTGPDGDGVLVFAT